MTSRHTRAAIVAACRRMMQAGRLRPPMRACCAMLDALGSKGPKPFQREPEPVRVRGLRDAFSRIGNLAKAALYEQRLAEIETRALEAWAVDAPAGGSTP